MKKKGRPRNVDWESMYPQYRANIKSNCVLAEEFGCSESAIRKHAIEHKWTRDLSQKIAERTQDLVRIEQVRELVRTESPSDKQIIEIGAETQKNVILTHRGYIKRLRELALRLLEEIEIMSENNALFLDISAELRSPDRNGVDRLNDLYQRVISVPDRVEATKKLADILKILIPLEREAFGIESRNSGTGLEDNQITNIGITFVQSDAIRSPVINLN